MFGLMSQEFYFILHYFQINSKKLIFPRKETIEMRLFFFYKVFHVHMS